MVCHFLFQWVMFVRTFHHDPSWMALHGMTCSFIELPRVWAMRSFWLAFYDCSFCSGGSGIIVSCFFLSSLWWMRRRGLCKLPDGRDWLWGKLSLALVGRTRKDTDAGKDWGQKEKEKTEDEMVRQNHQLNGHEFEQTPRDSEGQRSLVCCSPWGYKESERT